MAEPTAQSGDEWMGDGECGRHDPELFFLDNLDGRSKAEQIAAAKAVCNRCPVQAECLAWALRTRQSFGVWGGMTDREREQWQRGRAKRSTPPESVLNNDVPDELTVERLIAGERVCGAARIDIATAAVRLFRGGMTKNATAVRLGCDGSQVRVWVQRADRGEALINPEWLAQQRRRAERLLEAVSA